MRIRTGRNTSIGALAAALLALGGPAHGQSPELTLHSGLTVNFTIYGGYRSNGEPLGDYDFVNRVSAVGGGGYSYDFWMTGPAAASGSQRVSATDNARGTRVREYYPNGDMTAPGYVSFLRLSDATFAALKSGGETKLEFDDAENPGSIHKVGEEDLTTLVNERLTTLHTLKVVGVKGGTYWILDNPDLPMVIRGEMKWKWMVTAIGDAGGAGAQVVNALKTTHEATTHAILFAFDSAQIEDEAKPVLDSVAAFLKASPLIRLGVQGHTDNIGGGPYNLTLSQKRAEAVCAYLIATGIDKARFTAKGFGSTVPVADNTTPEGRAQNRRVVFKIG